MENRIKELEKEFAKLKEAREGLVEEGKILNQKLNEIDKQMVMKQGAYEELIKYNDKNKKIGKGDKKIRRKKIKE